MLFCSFFFFCLVFSLSVGFMSSHCRYATDFSRAISYSGFLILFMALRAEDTGSELGHQRFILLFAYAVIISQPLIAAVITVPWAFLWVPHLACLLLSSW